MEKEDYSLATAALATLPTSDAVEFASWCASPDFNNPELRAYVAEYQDGLFNPNQLPSHLRGCQEEISELLKSSRGETEWGLLTTDDAIIKISDGPDGNSGKLLVISEYYFSELLRKLFPNERMTFSERRILLQLIIGKSTKKAAIEDTVSYETKKFHLKVVYQKTGLRSQQEITNYLLAQILLSSASSHSRLRPQAHADDIFFRFVDNFMGPYVRASVIQHSENERYRVIEIGDPDGYPVVCVHHLAIVHFSDEEVETIKQNGIRLICPLRLGAVSDLDPFVSTSQHMDHAMGGIELAGSLTGKKKYTLLALLGGGHYALEFLRRNPTKIESVFFLGGFYRQPTTSDSHTNFTDSIYKLAAKDYRTLRMLVKFLLRNVDDHSSLRKVWDAFTNHCESDQKFIDGIFSDAKLVSSTQYRLKHSASSITQDLLVPSKSSWQSLAESSKTTQIYFVHGTKDSLCPYSTLAKLTQQYPHFTLLPVEGAGNWVFGKYIHATFAHVRKIVNNVKECTHPIFTSGSN